MNIRKMQTAAGGPLKLTSEELKYLEWSKMTPELKKEYRTNRAKSHLLSGPNITNFWEAFQTYIGNRDPENPRLNTGIVNVPGRTTPQLVLLSAKLMETINNYWKNLGKLKIRLGGNGKYASGILTKPGTAPITFNGLNISYITSPKGGNVTHKFYTDQGSEYILTKDGFARRIKSPHSNVGGSDSGLHDWNEGTTIFTKGEDGKTFNLAFDVLGNKYKEKFLKYGLIRENGIAKIMGIDPTTNQWRYIKYSDVYPLTIKQGLRQDGIIQAEYSDIPFLEGNILEKTSGSWHPGSQVAFIEGLKQGGKMNVLEFLKNGSGIHIKKKNRGKFTDYCGGKVTDECIRKAKASGNPTLVKRATFAANARKWKHKKGGKAFVSGVSILDSNPSAYKEVKKRLKKHLFGGDIILPNDYSNPNAFGGVFRDIMLGRLRDYELQQYKKKLKEQQLIVDALLELQKSDTISNLLGTAINKGLDLGMNYLSNKFANKALDKNGTPSTIQPKLTTNTWKPSTSLFTPSLGTRAQGSIPDFSYMLNPNYKL